MVAAYQNASQSGASLRYIQILFLLLEVLLLRQIIALKPALGVVWICGRIYSITQPSLGHGSANLDRILGHFYCCQAGKRDNIFATHR